MAEIQHEKDNEFKREEVNSSSIRRDRDTHGSDNGSAIASKSDHPIDVDGSIDFDDLDGDQDRDDDDSGSSKPSVFKIMVKHHDSISQTISLIHKESAKFNINVNPNSLQELSSPKQEAKRSIEDNSSQQKQLDEQPSNLVKASNCNKLIENHELEGLNCFLTDSNVQKLIKNVAGDNTTSLIDKTLNAVKSSKSIEEKRTLLTGGIKQLHSDLKSKKDTVTKDPLFSLALGFAGLNHRSIRFD